jgi:MFS family permease
VTGILSPAATSTTAREVTYPHAVKRYITALLLLVYVCNQADRSIFSVLMEPIKRDLDLSDSQLGFVAGPALALLYTTLGIPIARWGDRSNRVNIMSGAIAIWSCVVMLFAAVDKFWHLALAQIGVGVGEAGFTAIAMSVIGDYHPAEGERARAFSIFMLAIPIGGVVSDLLAGWINEAYGWRAVFIAAGVPGFILAVLLKWTIREPTRQRMASVDSTDQSSVPLRAVFGRLWHQVTLRHLAIAQCLANIVACVSSWFPAFLIRNHGMDSGAAGTWCAAIFGIGGGGGIWLSGYLTSRYSAKGEHFKMRVMAVATALVAPTLVIALWCSSTRLACLVLIPCQALMFFFLTPTLSSVQALSAPNVRATMTSVFILFELLAGNVVGIQLLGILSDAITPISGDSASALRLSMTLIGLFAIWAAVHFLLAERAVIMERRA